MPRSSEGSMLDVPRVWQAMPGQALELELPADALSLTLLATGGAGELLSFEVRAGERRLVDPTASETSLNRVLRGRGSVVGAIPSSPAALPLGPALAVSAVKLSSERPDPVEVTAWVKRGLQGASVPAVQELPLALVLVGAEAPAGLDTALGTLTGIWRRAGLEVRTAMQVRVEGPRVVEVDPTLGSESAAVGEALRLSRDAPAGMLVLVVVSDLTLPGSDLGLWALSGAIPVPPIQGTSRSGVLVSGAFLSRDPILGGQILAHEVGHALGLYHTTERPLINGQPIHDQLDDTAACPAQADADKDGFLDARECAGQDAGNLMFWATPRGATALTPRQAELARRSALAR